MLRRVNTSYGVVWRQTQLKELIREVDSHEGEPDPETVKRLAEKYGDTEAYVRMLFRTKRYRTGEAREERKKLVERSLAKRKRDSKHRWLEEELEFLRANWDKMTDKELAEALSGLPCNRARGKKRSRWAVAGKRSELGLRKAG